MIYSHVRNSMIIGTWKATCLAQEVVHGEKVGEYELNSQFRLYVQCTRWTSSSFIHSKKTFIREARWCFGDSQERTVHQTTPLLFYRWVVSVVVCRIADLIRPTGSLYPYDLLGTPQFSGPPEQITPSFDDKPVSTLTYCSNPQSSAE